MKTNLLELLKLSKAMKSYYVYYNPLINKLIGTDEHMTYIKVIDTTGIAYPIALFFKNSDMQKIAPLIKEYDYEIIDNNNVLVYSDGLNMHSISIMNYNFAQVEGMYFRTMQNISSGINQNTMTVDNLRGDALFENVLSLKSKQGIGFFNINRMYNMSIFSNLLPVNKSDGVSLKIYDNLNSRTFLANFTVRKPKNVNIDIFINYLKI